MTILNNIVYYFANPAISFLTLAGLVAIWAITKKVPSISIISRFIYLNIIVTIFRSVYCTFTNYWMWSQSPNFKTFLEPAYFIKFSINHYWLNSIAAIIFGFLFFKLIVFLNKKFDDRFFYEQEPYLILLGIVVNPWPMLLFFVVFSIVCLLVLQIINLFIQIINIKNKKTELERMPMLYIWIPAMFLSLLIYFVMFTGIFTSMRAILANNIVIKTLFESLLIFK